MTIFMTFTWKWENEEYDAVEGAQKVLEYIKDGFPIVRSNYYNDTDLICIHFGCRGAIITEEEI